MSTTNRTALITKLYKVLKKHYKAPSVRGDQPVLQTLLFACTLENAKYEVAEQVYGLLKSSYFDWNEIRVTTVKELSEVMHALPDAVRAAANLKGVLQSVFESEYSFEIDSLKKQNIGQATKKLEKLDGATPFVVAYTTQMALGGHAIPLDRGALGVLVVLGVISEQEAAAHNVPGLERTIPKSKGQEFGLLLHQIGAEFVASPFSPHLRDLLLSIAPDCKERLPKRTAKKPPEPLPTPERAKEVKAKHVEPEKLDGKKKATDRKSHEKAQEKQKPTEARKKEAVARKGADHGHRATAAQSKKKAAAKRKVPTKQLAKRKPR